MISIFTLIGYVNRSRRPTFSH